MQPLGRKLSRIASVSVQLIIPILTYWKFLDPRNQSLIGPPGSELNYTQYLAEAAQYRDGFFGLTDRFGFPKGIPLLNGPADISQLLVFIYADWVGRLLNPYLTVHLWHFIGTALTGIAVARLARLAGANTISSAIAGLLAQSIPIVQESGVSWETMSHIWPMIFLVTHLYRTLVNPHEPLRLSLVTALMVLSLAVYYYWFVYSVLSVCVWLPIYLYQRGRPRIACLAAAAILFSPLLIRLVSNYLISGLALQYRVGPRSRQWAFLGIERPISPHEFIDRNSSFYLGPLLFVGIAGLAIASAKSLSRHRVPGLYLLLLTGTLIATTYPLRTFHIFGLTLPTPGGLLNWSLPRFRVTARAAFLFGPLLTIGAAIFVSRLVDRLRVNSTIGRWSLVFGAFSTLLLPLAPLRYFGVVNDDSVLFRGIKSEILRRPHGAILDFTTRVPGLRSVLKSGHPVYLREGELNPITMTMQSGTRSFATALGVLGITHVVSVNERLISAPGFPSYSPSAEILFRSPDFVEISQHSWVPDPTEPEERYTVTVYEVSPPRDALPTCLECPFVIIDTDEFQVIDSVFVSEGSAGVVNVVSTEPDKQLPMTLVMSLRLVGGGSDQLTLSSKLETRRMHLIPERWYTVTFPVGEDESIRLFRKSSSGRLEVRSINVIPQTELASFIERM